MKITPMNDRILVKKLKRDEKQGNLLLLDTKDQYTGFYEIIAIDSCTCSNDVYFLKKGERIMIAQYSEVPVPGMEDHYMVKFENVLGVVNE